VCADHQLPLIAREGRNYHRVEATKRLWTEPGRGVVDFDAVTAAMPEDYDGDYMIEVVEKRLLPPRLIQTVFRVGPPRSKSR
jgi:inosose dehydratase